MSAKVGFFFVVFFLFLIGADNLYAQSGASAQIGATATVVIPVGFYDNQSSPYTCGSDSTAIVVGRPKNSGIIVVVKDGGGIFRQFSFSAGDKGEERQSITGAEKPSLSLEQARLPLDDYTFENSCIITVIFSEN